MKNSLLGVIFYMASTMLCGQDKPLSNSDDFRVKFAKTADVTRNISSDYIQTKHSVYFKEPLLSKGIFLYDQTGKMRWEQKTPEKHIILINGEELLIWNKGKVNKYNLSSNKQLAFIKLMMMGTVNGDLLNSGKFDITYFYSEKLYKLVLIPKDKKLRQMFAEINLYFDKQTIRLKEMTLIESEGDYTSILFINAIFNTQISQTVFSEF